MERKDGEQGVCACVIKRMKKDILKSSLRQIFMMSGAVLVLTAGDQREPCVMGTDSAFSRPVSLVAF